MTRLTIAIGSIVLDLTMGIAVVLMLAGKVFAHDAPSGEVMKRVGPAQSQQWQSRPRLVSYSGREAA